MRRRPSVRASAGRLMERTDGGEISAAVPEGETMRLCRWRARAMFDRDNILDEEGLAVVGKRFEGAPRTQELATRG